MYLILPAPPSLNVYYETKRVGRFHGISVSRKGREYHRLLGQYRQILMLPTFDFDISMTLECFPKARNQRDIDNYFKCLNDSLQSAGIIKNDNLIRWQLGKMQAPFREWPCVLLRIERMAFRSVTIIDRVREIRSTGETIVGMSLAPESVKRIIERNL